MKSEEELKNIAKQIFDLELECQNEVNVTQNMAKIEQLIKILSVDDIFKIDTYITNKNFLTE